MSARASQNLDVEIQAQERAAWRWALIVAVVILALGLILWSRYGSAVFFDTISSAILACF